MGFVTGLYYAAHWPSLGGQLDFQLRYFKKKIGRRIMKYFKFVPLCLLLPAIAQAHIMLEQPTAPANSSYKAALLVMHGCDGSPTTRVTVTIPEDIVLTKPMPK